MRITHETYRRATTGAIIGAVFHTVMTVVVLVLGFSLGDTPARIVGLAMAIGLPVWVSLILVFHQSALEQRESLEKRQLEERGGSTGAIFEFGADEDLRHAARLRWMHRFMLPAMSLVIAGLYLGLGWWQRLAITGALTKASEVDVAGIPKYSLAGESVAGWGAAVTAAIALVSFVVSWYLGGMSRHKAWRLLRAGATVTINGALCSAALALGYGFQLNGNDIVLRSLVHILPIYIMVLGGEIVVSFIINLYTPRKPGEYPVPAFDSRVLGLLAAPESVIKSINDAINYQFGFSVTTTWFYQLLVKQLLPLAGFIVVLLITLNCVRIVQPNEQAIVTSVGRLTRGSRVFNSGPVLKWPWERVERTPVSQIHQVVVGVDSLSNDSDAILWTKKHTVGDEDLIIVGPTTKGLMDSAEGGPAVARSIAVLNAEVPVQYRIKTGHGTDGASELLNYINFVGGDDRQRTLLVRQIATRVVHQYLGSMSIDDVLGPRRSALPGELRDRIQAEFDKRNAGIEVVFVGVAGIHPPVDVAASFEQVLEAHETHETLIEGARATAITRLSTTAGSEARARSIADRIKAMEEAGGSQADQTRETVALERDLMASGGSAAAMILSARAARWLTHMEQLAYTIRQRSRLAPYLAAPDYYRNRAYLLMLTRALQGRDLVIVPEGVEIRATIDLQNDPTLLNATNIGATMSDTSPADVDQ